jgi:dihydrolipoamide dehydrogenase
VSEALPGASREVQVAVIGAGPGGYAAAFHAADLGLKVALVDSDPRPGGVCLNRGCIPSKALLHAAKLINEAREAEAWGIRFSRPEVDIKALRSWKDGVVARLVDGIDQLCRARKVDLLRARATFTDSRTLRLEWAADDKEGERPAALRFEHAILATGSTPAMPQIFQIGDPRVMDSTGALEIDAVPGTLLVVGGGYIGLEMGTVYAALGSKVTVVELLDGLLPGADRDLVRPLQTRLAKTFAAIHLKTKVEGLTAKEAGIEARVSGEGAPGGGALLFDRVLVAIGRRPNSRGLGLESTKVTVDEKGFVQVDRHRRTADPHIFAIGDVAGEPMLAHKASREGKVAAEVIAGEPAEFDNLAIPAVVFTDPEVAWCGLTENEAKAAGREVKVAKFPWAASGRAITLDRPEGLTKILIDPSTGRVLGMGIVGSGAGELIAEGVLAIEMGAVARDIADTIHAHPTLSETVMESAEVILGNSTHVYRPARKARAKERG